MQLFNGDCLELMRSLPDSSIDAILTDPPYGILNHKIEQVFSIPEFLGECDRLLKPNSFLAFFGRQPTLTKWNSAAMDIFKYKQEIIWYKRHRSSPTGDMGRVFENISVWTKSVKGARKFNPVRRPYTDVKESLAEFTEWSNLDKDISRLRQAMREPERLKTFNDYLSDKSGSYLKRTNCQNDYESIGTTRQAPKYLQVLNTLVNGNQPQNLISFTPHNRQRNDMTGNGGGDFNIKHPCVKPIELMEYLAELMSNPGDIILDPFMGSGTTGIACKNVGRDFIGYELDSEYFEIAKTRIENHDRNAPTIPKKTRKPPRAAIGQLELF